MRRCSLARLPLPQAGEGWGEGGRLGRAACRLSGAPLNSPLRDTLIPNPSPARGRREPLLRRAQQMRCEAVGFKLREELRHMMPITGLKCQFNFS